MDHDRRVWRQSVGATLAEVAALIGSGCSKTKVHRWELGVQPSSIDDRKWLAALRQLKARAEKRLANVSGTKLEVEE